MKKVSIQSCLGNKKKGEFINETIDFLLVGAVMRKFFLSIRTQKFCLGLRIRVYFILKKEKRKKELVYAILTTVI